MASTILTVETNKAQIIKIIRLKILFKNNKDIYIMSYLDYRFNKNVLKRKRKVKEIDEEPSEDEMFPLENLGKLFGGGNHDVVDKVKNHIFFYCDVNTQSCLALNQHIISLNKELQKVSIDYNVESPNIYLHINSYGGDILSCFSSIDYIRNSKIPVISIIEGCAASAATLLSIVCSKRYMTSHSFMLIHQLSSCAYGKYEELKDDMENSDRFMDMIYDLYLENTKIKKKALEKMLKKDLWWDIDTCMKNGLVDEPCDNRCLQSIQKA